jgi:hypothetical protein
LYFGCGGAVDECPAHVGGKLVWPVERRQHRQIEQAPGLALEPVAAPDNAPAVLGDKLLDRPGERSTCSAPKTSRRTFRPCWYVSSCVSSDGIRSPSLSKSH